MNPDSYERLVLRVRDLENVVGALRADLEAARPRTPEPAPAQAAPAAPEPPTVRQIFAAEIPPHVPAPAATRPARPAKPAVSLETLLAGRGLLLVGLLLVLLAAGFFLNVAIARGWLGPAQQVLLALAVGSALIAYAARRIGRDLTFLAEGLIGLGAGIDFLALWASVMVFPELHVPRAVAFAGMVAVTALLALLATRRHSERLALLGLLGGYLTPVLLASGPPDRAFLAAYLLILTATMLALGVRSSFRSVEVLAFVAVACYSPAFVIDRPQHWTDVMCATVATIFFATFALAYTLAALHDGKVTSARLTLLVLNATGYAFILEVTFWARQHVLGWTLLALAAVLLATARVPALPPRLSKAYFYLGLSAVTLALPALLGAMSLTDVFIVEAALLVLIGTRGADRWVMLAGAVLFVLTGVTLLSDATGNAPQHAILSSLALGFAIYVAALSAALSQLRMADLPERARRGWWNAGAIALNAVALAGLSRECVDVLGGPKGLDDLSNEGQLGLSVTWTLYATGLFAYGMARRQGLLRWLALALFGWTIFKVFIVDLAALNVVYRILSFLGLGIMLVAVSAWYQRTMARQKAAEAQP